MKQEYEISPNIRGTRYVIHLSKTVKGWPGFAPESYEATVGDVIVKYDDEIPYFQCHEAPPILSIENIEEIVAIMKRGYIESDFKVK